MQDISHVHTQGVGHELESTNDFPSFCSDTGDLSDAVARFSRRQRDGHLPHFLHAVLLHATLWRNTRRQLPRKIQVRNTYLACCFAMKFARQFAEKTINIQANPVKHFRNCCIFVVDITFERIEAHQMSLELVSLKKKL